MTSFVGIDPGLTGGIAKYDPKDVQKSWVMAMPITDGGFVDAPRIAQWLRLFDGPYDHVCIEHVSSRPRQAGVFNFGLNTGIIHGVLGALNIPFQTIPSSRWKPAMGLQRGLEEDYKANKERARLLAIQLFPHLAHDLHHKKDDGKAEALLLAVYFANQQGKEKK